MTNISKHIREAAKRYGINASTIQGRLDNGWTFYQATRTRPGRPRVTDVPIVNKFLSWPDPLRKKIIELELENDRLKNELKELRQQGES